MSDANLRIEIQAIADQAIGQISQLENQLSQLAGQTQKIAVGEQLQRVGSQMTSVGQSIVGTFGGGLMSVVQTAGQFEASMNGVRAVTQATGSDFEALQSQAKELGGTTAFSASEAAQGMQYLGMAGFEATQILEAMPDVLNLASAGNLDLARTADVASNIMSGFGIEASEMGRVADVLAHQFRSANTDIVGLGEGFKYAGPIAKAFGMSLEETSATLGLLASAGIQGGQAGTVLRGALSRLVDPTSRVQETLDGLGVSIKDASGEYRGFADILTDFAGSSAGLQEISTVFGTEASSGMLNLIEGIRSGDDNLLTMIETMQNAKGSAEEMAGIQMEGFAGGVDGLSSAFERLQLAIAEAGVLDVATELVGSLTSLTQSLSNVDPRILKVGTGLSIVGVAIGALLIPLGMVVGAIGTLTTAFAGFNLVAITAGFKGFGVALGAIALPFLKIGAIIAGVVFSLVSVVNLIRNVISAFQEFGVVQGILIVLQTAVLTFYDVVAGAFIGLITAIGVFITAIVTGIGTAVMTFVGAGLQILASIASWIEGIFGFPPVVSEALNQAAQFVFAAAAQFMQGGIQMIQGLINGAVSAFGGFRSAIASGINGGISIIQGMYGAFMSAGAGLIGALISGVQSKLGELKSIVANGLGEVRAMLPFSDAKEGPLSTLTYSGGALITTLAEGIMTKQNLLPQVMAQVLPNPMGMMSTMGEFSLPHQNMPFQVMSQVLPSPVMAMSTMGELPVSAYSGGGGQSTSMVNSNNHPVNVEVHLHGSSGEARGSQSLIQQLRREGDEIAKIVEKAIATRDRTKYLKG